MFEAKLENVIEKISETSEEEKYVQSFRKQQICEVVDSLTEEEFICLQENLKQTFEEVETLFQIVEEKIQSRAHYEEIVQAVNEAYRNSTECSSYYKKQFLN